MIVIILSFYRIILFYGICEGGVGLIGENLVYCVNGVIEMFEGND